MKVTLALLYGFLEIVAEDQKAPIRLGVEFNTVAWNYLSRPLRRLLQASVATPDRLTDNVTDSPPTQKDVEKLPRKFSNGVKIYGLLPGEKLEELVFQSNTWKRWLYFFRQPVSAKTLLMLTTNYVVVIQEALDVEQGWIISYIPRNNIAGMQNHPCGLWNELSVQLKRDRQSVEYKLILDSEVVEAWRRQWVQHGGQWQELQSEQA